MMIYILNDKIKYNSDCGEIVKISSNQCITTFTPLLNRIFRILIENNNKIIPRDELLKMVWDDHGLNSSTNTLNQYISTLRKFLLQYLNIDNAILTIPKKGIIISSEVTITSLSEQNNNKAENCNEKTNEKINENQQHSMGNVIIPVIKNDSVKKIKKNLILNNLVLTMLFIVLLLGCLVLSFNLYNKKSHYDKINIYKMSEIDNCPVYTFRKDYNEKRILAIIDEHIKNNKIYCSAGDIYYYYDNYKNSGIKKQSLLVKCKSNNICISSRINKQDPI